jgi:peroxiredoxin
MHRSLAILATLFFLAVGCIGQESEDKWRLAPTPDPTASFKVYIPKDLEDSLVELSKMLDLALIAEMKASSEENMILYHDDLGRWIRNNWALWAGSRLSKYFNQLGIFHPDDMSGIILTSYWRHLQSRPIKLDEQVEYYKEYWRKTQEKEAAVTRVPETAMNRPLRSYDGERITIADYEGKVIVLAWWYLLCKPSELSCQMIPHLVTLKKRYGAQGLEVIGMPGIYPFKPARDTSRVRKLVREYGINFKLVWDDDDFTYDIEEYDKFGYSSSPQVLVISRNGYVVKRIRGFDPAVLHQAVEQAMKPF